MRLRELAHVRTGDKGDISQISVIVYDPADFERVARFLTPDRIGAALSVSPGSIRRYELPRLGALNIVLENALRGGVTRSLELDPHGKTLGAQLLALDIEEA